jgi:hypothetical protein
MENKPIIFLIGAGIALLIGLTIWVVVIFEQRNHYLPDHTECPTIPPMDSFDAVKKITGQWNWRYRVRNSMVSAKSEMYCPTTQYDVNVFKEGQLVGRSDGKILTTVSKTYIRDCHGKKIFVMRIQHKRIGRHK